MRNFLRRYGATLAWALALFTLSSIPDLTSPLHISKWDDKWQHTLAYMPFGWLLVQSLSWNGRKGQSLLWLAIVIGVLYGISDEIHQYFVPGRFADWRDVLADAIGVSVGGWLGYRRQKRKLSSEANASMETKRTVSV
jgi:VanZ family protein